MTIQKTVSWMVVIVVAVGLVVLAYLKSGKELQAPTPPVGGPPPSATLSPGPVPTLPPTVYENEYMSVQVPSGWNIAQSGKTAGVNITKGKYILYINPRASQASGVTGGRFAEIAQGAPSADAVVTVQPSQPCGTQVEVSFGAAYRQDLYVSSKDKKDWCAVPTSGKTVWYFSYVNDVYGWYLNQYKEYEELAWVVTMSYNAKDVNSLPEKDSPELTQMLGEMTQIFQTLQLKTPTP